MRTSNIAIFSGLPPNLTLDCYFTMAVTMRNMTLLHSR